MGLIVPYSSLKLKVFLLSLPKNISSNLSNSVRWSDFRLDEVHVFSSEYSFSSTW